MNNVQRFKIVDDYVEGFGDCYLLIDSEDEFSGWHSMSWEDLKYLCTFLNKQHNKILELQHKR